MIFSTFSSFFLRFPFHLFILVLHRLHRLLSKLLLMFLDLLFEFLIDRISGRCIDDVLVLVHKLPLDLQHGWVVLHYPPDDIMSRFGGVIVANYLCTLIEGWSEKIIREFLLTSFVDVLGVLLPRVGDEDDVLQCRFAADFPEYAEIRPAILPNRMSEIRWM